MLFFNIHVFLPILFVFVTLSSCRPRHPRISVAVLRWHLRTSAGFSVVTGAPESVPIFLWQDPRITADFFVAGPQNHCRFFCGRTPGYVPNFLSESSTRKWCRFFLPIFFGRPFLGKQLPKKSAKKIGTIFGQYFQTKKSALNLGPFQKKIGTDPPVSSQKNRH